MNQFVNYFMDYLMMGSAIIYDGQQCYFMMYGSII